MLKFEIKTKKHQGDKRTFLRYETTEVKEVLAAFEMEAFTARELKSLLDGKFKAFRMGTSVRIVNLTPEVKKIVESIIG